jgi:predicted RNA polymerase sigma factor
MPCLPRRQQWPVQGVPDHPRGWLIRVGYRRMIDQLRADQARQRREYELAGQSTPASLDEPATDDSLTLLFLCCHPVLSPVSQVALTLRAVGGLSTAEIAHAYGVTEVAMGQRISRAKMLGYFVEQRERARRALEAERERSERLLLNVLPEPIAERLKVGTGVIADHYDTVSVL